MSQIYLIKYSTCFGQVHCLSSGISQHCIHAIGICHVSSGWNSILTMLADNQQNWHDKYLLCEHSVEILLMTDSGLDQNV
jgi:hypothetical protein